VATRKRCDSFGGAKESDKELNRSNKHLDIFAAKAVRKMDFLVDYHGKHHIMLP
jgi:hypothetical protein